MEAQVRVSQQGDVGHACDKMGREQNDWVQKVVWHPARKEDVIVALMKNAEAADYTSGEEAWRHPQPKKPRDLESMVLEPATKH